MTSHVRPMKIVAVAHGHTPASSGPDVQRWYRSLR